jgi:ADP-ribose pyrophosphatase
LSDFSIRDRTVVFRGRLLALEELDVVGPSGESVLRESVVHPGAVAVLPLFSDQSVLLCRQYRAPIDDSLLEVPAGKLKPGESPSDCARRELLEETGLSAGYLIALASFYTSPGFTNEIMHSFLACDVRSGQGGITEPHGVEERHMELVRVPLRDWPQLVEAGAIRDAKSIVTLALSARRLGIDK